MLQLQFFENLTSVSYKKKRDIHLSNAKIPEGPGDREILNFYLGDKIKVCYFLPPAPQCQYSKLSFQGSFLTEPHNKLS